MRITKVIKNWAFANMPWGTKITDKGLIESLQRSVHVWEFCNSCIFNHSLLIFEDKKVSYVDGKFYMVNK